MKENPSPARVWWIALALAGITVAVYLPVLNCDFLTFDDQIYVTENPYVRARLNWNSLAWAFQTTTSGNWIPLTWISHILDSQFFRMNAGGHHFTSVLIHAANAALLFLVLREMTGAVWRSAIVAALFAGHPAHVESVAWISERKDVLSALFFILTLWAYARWARNLKSQFSNLKFYWLALLFFALGLLSKPMVVSLPFVLLLLDIWPLGRFSRPALGRLLLEKAPFFILTAASCMVTVWAQGKSQAVAGIEGLGLGRRIEHVLASYLDYLRMLVFPRGLAVFYPYRAHEDIAMVLAGAAVLVILTFLTLAGSRRRPWLGVGWLWFIGMLVPVIGLVQVGNQAMADRYTYLPAIGLFVIVAWGGAELAARFPALKYAAAVIGLVLLGCTWRQVHYWKDTKTLFEHANQVTRDNDMALAMLGSLCASDGDTTGAIALYHEALRINPGNSKAHFFYARSLETEGNAKEAEAEYETAVRQSPGFEPGHIFLGVLLAKEKRYDEAAAQYEAVLKLNPRSANAHNDLAHVLQVQGRLDESAAHYRDAIKYDSSLAQAHNNLGVLCLQMGRLDEAIAELRQGLVLNPGNPETEYNLAVALNQARQWPDAAEILQDIAGAQPKNPAVHYQYGLSLAGLGQTRPAMAQFAQSILLKDDYADALNAMAWIAATTSQAELRNGPQAVAMAQRACDLTGGEQPTMLLTLAAALAETGKFKEAAALAEKSRQFAATKGNKQLEEKAARLSVVFSKGQPFRENAQAQIQVHR